MSDDTCTCLHRESRGEFDHATRCALGGSDGSDIRELAEIAATTDIDTAMYVYRSYLARTAKGKGKGR